MRDLVHGSGEKIKLNYHFDYFTFSDISDSLTIPVGGGSGGGVEFKEEEAECWTEQRFR